MSRVHDMGGRYGDGPITPGASSDPPFEKDWHARALALTLAAGGLGQWNLDISRHARERLAPNDYSTFSYYEKWLAGLAELLVERGVVTKEELAGGSPTSSDLTERRLPAAAVAGVLAKGGPADRPGSQGRFSVGDAVLTRPRPNNAFVDGGHTRLPGYAAGLTGRIIATHGCHVLPDANAHDLGEQPETLYTVAFRAADMWDRPEHPDDEVMLDLWDSYLSPA